MATIIDYDPQYRDDMIFMVLSAKDALGRIPRLNEDLLDVEGHYRAVGGAFWLALDEGGRVVGSVGCVMADSGDAVLHRLYVKPHCKRQGIGSALLARAEAFAHARGCARVLVHLGDPVTYRESRLFYPHHGYVFLDHDHVAKMLGE